MTFGILCLLAILSFFLIKPILMSIVFGIILAFVLYPIYSWISRKIKSKNFSALIVCFLLILGVVFPLWFLVPILVSQSFEIYLATQKMNFVTPLKAVFSSFFHSEELSNEIGSVIFSFVTNLSNSLMNSFSRLILNFPTLFLQLIVVFFTLFFVLRDKEEFIQYIKTLLPFPKEIEKKLFKSSEEITKSILYGQVIIGVLQGLLVGFSFFLFDIPNALVMTLIACLAGIFPIIGTFIIWFPIVIYSLIGENSFAALGITFFGIISSNIDNILRPILISKKTTLHSSLVLIGMVGGLFLFGILGVILGPLILAYLFIILEIYRKKRESNVFIQYSK